MPEAPKPQPETAVKGMEDRAKENRERMKQIIKEAESPETKALQEKLVKSVEKTLAELPKSPKDLQKTPDQLAKEVEEISEKAIKALDEKNQDKVIADANKDIEKGEPGAETPTVANKPRGGGAAATEI